MEYKVFADAELKVLPDGAGQLAGYASTWEPWDRVGEKPVRGAFAASLPAFLKGGFIAYGHDWAALPIATPSAAYEDEHGLFFSAEFHSTPFAQETRTVITERLARGKSVTTSIGYEPPDREAVEAPDLPGGYGTLLKVVPLLEISVVPVPANPAALLTTAKGLTLPAGVPLTESHEWALAALHSYLQRVADLRDLRAKDGRVLSEANRTKLASLRGSLADVLAILEQLLADSAPAPKGLAPALLDEYLRFAVQEARMQGVLI